VLSGNDPDVVVILELQEILVAYGRGGGSGGRHRPRQVDVVRPLLIASDARDDLGLALGGQAKLGLSSALGDLARTDRGLTLTHELAALHLEDAPSFLGAPRARVRTVRLDIDYEWDVRAPRRRHVAGPPAG